MTRTAINLQEQLAQVNESLDAAGSHMPPKHRQMGVEVVTRAALVANNYDVDMYMKRLLDGETVELPSVDAAMADFKAVAAKRPDAMYNSVVEQALTKGETLGHAFEPIPDNAQNRGALNREISKVVDAYNTLGERYPNFQPARQNDVERVGEVVISEAELAELNAQSVDDIVAEMEHER